MRRFLFVILLVMGFITVMMSLAQDVPAENDNECYAGGLLEGQCISDWHWECGWYIRNHRTTGAPVPAWCGQHEEQATISPYPSVYCISTAVGSVQFAGSWWMKYNAQLYYEGCEEPIDLVFFVHNIVYAPPSFDPDTLCKAAFGPTARASFWFAPYIYNC